MKKFGFAAAVVPSLSSLGMFTSAGTAAAELDVALPAISDDDFQNERHIVLPGDPAYPGCLVLAG